MADVRLIDANKAEKEFEYYLNLLCKNPITSNTYEMSFSRQICNAALRILRNTPTIDPETLRLVAHWEESVCFDDAFWVCSNCKFPSEAIAAPRLYHYCPVCGSKME